MSDDWIAIVASAASIDTMVQGSNTSSLVKRITKCLNGQVTDP